MAPGGCVTSWDPAQNRSAVFLAGGKSVPFVAGMYSPQNGGVARKLLQGGIGSSGSSVWTNFTNLEARTRAAAPVLQKVPNMIVCAGRICHSEVQLFACSLSCWCPS